MQDSSSSIPSENLPNIAIYGSTLTLLNPKPQVFKMMQWMKFPDDDTNNLLLTCEMWCVFV